MQPLVTRIRLRGRQRGFSMLEMLLAITVLMLAVAPVLGLFVKLQKSYGGTQNRIEAQAAARSALNLMASEIELAGSNPTVDTVLSANVGPCANPCTIAVTSGAGLSVGDVISVDVNGLYEQTTVTAVGNGTFNAVLQFAHTNGAPVVYPGYPYGTGVWASTCAASPCTLTKLQFYGNVLGDGKIYFMEYKYDSTAQKVTRSVTPVTAATKNSGYTICTNVTNASFILSKDVQGNWSNVTLSLTLQTTSPDPTTGQYSTVSMSRGVIQARNVALASQMAGAGNGSNVAQTPTNVSNLASQ